MTGVLPEILIQCTPNIFVLFKKKPQDFDKPYRQCVFFLSKTSLVFKKYPKISTGVNPEILIQCRPNIFALFNKPKILTSKSLPLGFGVKNMVLMKYPKILTGAKPKISIRCKPNIFVPFKSPKILTSKIGHGFFCLFGFFLCVSKTWFLWNTPRFWQVFYLTFWKIVGPKSLFSLKIPRFWQAK